MTTNILFNEKDKSWDVELTGELDVYNVPEMIDKVQSQISQKPAKVVFDFTHLDYIDSTGLGALVKIYRNVKDHGGIKLKGVKKHIGKIIYITELDKLFDVGVVS